MSVKTFDSWEKAHAWAQKVANETGIGMGIERSSFPVGPVEWLVHYLPRKENRSGWELRVESVDPGGEP